MATKQESNPELKRIGDAFVRNIDRVRKLVAASDSVGSPGRGRRPEVAKDMLRAAVVLLHASLEHLLRRALFLILPKTQDPRQLDDLTLRFPALEDGTQSREKLSIAELLPHRGKSVDELIDASIRRTLETTSFNNIHDVKRAVRRLGLTGVSMHEAKIHAMMQRRHLIAHRADAWEDRRTVQGTPLHRPLTKTDVAAWIEAIESAGLSVMNALRSLR